MVLNIKIIRMRPVKIVIRNLWKNTIIAYIFLYTKLSFLLFNLHYIGDASLIRLVKSCSKLLKHATFSRLDKENK